MSSLSILRHIKRIKVRNLKVGRRWFHHRCFSSAATPEEIRVAFASQSGTAHLFAEQLAEELEELVQVPVEVVTANELQENVIAGQDLSKSLLFVLAACYGRGEPPENAIKFYKSLVTEHDPVLSNGLSGVQFAVFGLGSSKTHKEHFNVIGKEIHSELVAVGGIPILDLTLGDDSGDIDEDFESFLDVSKGAVSRILASSPKGSLDNEALQCEGDDPEVHRVDDVAHSPQAILATGVTSTNFSRTTCEEPKAAIISTDNLPFKTTITRMDQISSCNTPSRAIYEMSLESHDPDTSFAFDAGDYLMISPENDIDQVLQFCDRLGLSPETVFPKLASRLQYTSGAGKVPTVENLLRYSFDFTQPVTSRAVQLIGNALIETGSARGIGDHVLSLRQDKERYNREIVQEHISIDEFITGLLPGGLRGDSRVLQSSPFIERLFATGVPKLCDRCYSISSTERMGKQGVVDITFRNISYTTPKQKKPVFGVATSFLHRIHESNTGPKQLNIKLRSGSFKLGKDHQSPIIMVAGGIGIAPFRAFMLERLESLERGAQVGPGMLFYGNKEAHSLVYTGLISESLGKGTLQSAHLSFDDEDLFDDGTLSKLHPDCKLTSGQYISSAFVREGEAIWDLLQYQGSRLYICGGVAGFGEGMVKALKQIAKAHGGLTEEQSEMFFSKLVSENRYLEDLAD